MPSAGWVLLEECYDVLQCEAFGLVLQVTSWASVTIEYSHEHMAKKKRTLMMSSPMAVENWHLFRVGFVTYGSSWHQRVQFNKKVSCWVVDGVLG